MSRQKSNFFIDDDGELGDDPETDPELNELVDLIREHYEPATSFRDSTLQLNTAAISERIRDIYPGSFKEKQLYFALKEAGFTLHQIGELELVWLLKER